MLGSKPLKYILISHFESDECGGFSLVLKEYPEAVAVCSETTARQLRGFGIAQKVQVMKPGETLCGSDFYVLKTQFLINELEELDELEVWRDILVHNSIFE